MKAKRVIIITVCPVFKKRNRDFLFIKFIKIYINSIISDWKYQQKVLRIDTDTYRHGYARTRAHTHSDFRFREIINSITVLKSSLKYTMFICT